MRPELVVPDSLVMNRTTYRTPAYIGFTKNPRLLVSPVECIQTSMLACDHMHSTDPGSLVWVDASSGNAESCLELLCFVHAH
jgi:hypothetical protein